MEVCAVIPAHNEARSIERVVKGTLEHVQLAIVLDDGSNDGTGKLAQRAGARVISHEVRQGKGVALRAGLLEAFAQGHDAVVMLDGDGQHVPGEIPRLIEAATRGADLVLGDRSGELSRMPLLRRITNQLLTRILGPFVGRGVRDTQCGFRLITAHLWAALRLRSRHFEIESEMLLEASRLGARIVQVPVSVVYACERSKIRAIPDTARFTIFLFRSALPGSLRSRRVRHQRQLPLSTVPTRRGVAIR